MREIRSYGSVGERGGNEPLYPEIFIAYYRKCAKSLRNKKINNVSHLILMY